MCVCVSVCVWCVCVLCVCVVCVCVLCVCSVCVCACVFSVVSDFFETPIDCSLLVALLFMGFPRQEYWSRLPFSSPGDRPDPRIKPASPALAGGFFTAEPPRKSRREERALQTAWEGAECDCWAQEGNRNKHTASPMRDYSIQVTPVVTCVVVEEASTIEHKLSVQILSRLNQRN